MNENRNKQWSRQNRNPSSQSQSNVSCEIEGQSHIRFSDRHSLNRMTSSPDQGNGNSKQESSYEQKSNFHLRSFRDGRESDTDQCQSLYEQRVNANQQRKQRGRINRRRNFRGFPRSRSSNFNRTLSKDSVSDNESVSSSGSNPPFPTNSLNFSFTNRNPPYSDTIPQASELSSYSNPSTSSWSRNQNVNTEVFSGGFIHAPRPVNDGEGCNSWSEKNLENQNSLSSSNLYAQDPKDRLSELRNYKESYDNLLKSVNPTDIILDCRQKVEDYAKEAIVHNLKKIREVSSRINSQNTCDVLKLHLGNLIRQQEQFEEYIAKVKGQLSLTFTSDIQDLLEMCDITKNKVEKECKVFKRSLAAYAFKKDILDKIQKNQVTVVTADSVYYLNILMPIFVKNEYPEHFLICSETSRILTERLKRNVFQLVHDKKQTDEIDEIKFGNEINFLTVDEMLNLFLNDYAVDEKNIFAVLNLSLKRSLNQDIVLTNVQDILLEKKQSKLVLMASCYDHIDKYVSFFSKITSVAVIKMPTLILPVRVVWKNCALLPADDYVEEVVKTVIAIHTLNDPGDVIVFLPTIADTKSVSVALNKQLSDLNYDNLKCDILVENSSNKSCLDLSSGNSSDKRMVFLATDCAELLVIPSVRYVVDCGLRKENIFDCSKKLDVLTTTFISRDKSKLRKSLAGIFSTGICYRLYNKENYQKEMPSIEYPEIYTVNPFNSMVKIFQHRPDTATTVEFVEPLPEYTKENALKLLKKYNAIKGNNLTALGRSIVKLPFPAKYSKLILLGIQWGLAYEAIILVAFFSVKGRVFQYSTDADRQRDIDAVKLQLIQHDSDTLSYLYIYKIWLENNCSNDWCDKQCINYTTLKSIQLKVNEICQTVGECLKENISQEFINTGKDSTVSLLEMLFDCFLENLCVFTGHYRSGYRVLSSHCIAFLHPSSIICQMENLPQFIVFDHMISTNRDFLISITAIPSDFIMKALTDQLIDYDYSDMFEKSLVQKIIEPVGERMIKQVLLGKKGKKLKAIECHVKAMLNTTSLVIEPVAEKGRVLVYALEHQIDEALTLVNEVLKRQFDDLVNLEQIRVLELKRGQITIPIELKWLRGAQVASVKVGMSSQSSVVIQNDLDTEENLSDQPPCTIQQSINITWIRRPCNGKGLMTFQKEDFMMARKFAMRSVPFFNTEVFVELSRFESNQLYFTGIPSDAKTSDLEKAFSNLLPGVKPTKVELKYKSPFETPQNQLQEIKDKIEELCYKYTRLSNSNINIVVPMPKQTATVMKAYINVNEDEDIDKAAASLSKCAIGDSKLICKPVYRSVIKCSLDVCEALKPRFHETLSELQCRLKKQFADDDLFEFVINLVADDLAAIKMLSNKCKILQTLQRIINELLEGEVLNKSFSMKLSKIFCHGGHMWLKSLEKTTNVFIMEDYANKTLRLYGSKEDCNHCKQRILRFLEDTENEAVTSIQLSGERKLLKEIIKKYGVNLEKLIESCELRTAVLDIKSCSLSLHGSRECIEKAEESLKEIASDLNSSTSMDALSGGEMCPVCACPAFNLTFRLELCGHLYCSECIEGLVEQAQFPIRCCAEDCCHDVVLVDICKALGDDPVKIKALLEKSMKHYIEARNDEIFYCPAPDCSMFFYRNEIPENKLNCPLCQNDLCLQCNVVYHHGYTCEIYQGSKEDPDYSFKIWQKTSTECKRCPKCNTAIEKDGGCDHMTCKNCNSHFCWQCVREFPSGPHVYEHLPYCDKYPKW